MLQRIFSGCLVGLVFAIAIPCVAQVPREMQAEISGIVVDANDKPMAGVSIKALGPGQIPKPQTTSDDGRFQFSADIFSDGTLGGYKIFAESANGQIAFADLQKAPAKDFKMVLKPTPPVLIQVNDGKGKPVANAPVKLLVGRILVLQEGLTDEQGSMKFHVPTETPDWSIVGHKSGVGFDYLQAKRGIASLDKQHAIPEKVTLKLDGAHMVRFHAVDQDNRPVAGIRIKPWLIHKPGYETQMNLSSRAVPQAITDEQGIATIDYLPARFERSIAFNFESKDYYNPKNNLFILAQNPAADLTINLLPYEKLSGRVTTADGKPAAGAIVSLRGAGTEFNKFQGGTIADADGRYELPVYTEQQYLVQAFHEGQISPIRSDAVVRVGKPVGNIDVVVAPPIKVRGKVTFGKDQTPAPKIMLYCSFGGGEVTKDLPRSKDTFGRPTLSSQMTSATNAAGEYEFFLAPGEYRLHGAPNTTPVTLKLTPADIGQVLTHNFQMSRAERGPLTGKVIDGEGKPVANAQVEGIYASRHARHRAPQVNTDENGTFRVERTLEPLVLYVRSAEKSLAGLARSDAEATEVTITLGPVTSASGKLRDHNGQVIADKELPYGIRVFMAEPGRSEWTDTFGGKVTTNAKGEFTLPNLVIGETYQLNYYFNETRSQTVKQIFVENTKPLALGDLQIDTSPPEAYTPPTPTQKTKEAFTGKRDIEPQTRLTNLLAEAKREYTRPLLLIGTPDDKACIDLFRLFDVRESKPGEKKEDYQAPNELRWQFELASLDRSHPPILEFIKAKKLDQAEQPLLAMLDADGQVVDALSLKLEGDKLNPRAIGAWMEKYKLPTRNAVQMYEAAVAKAKAEDKRVFLIFSASWCGPCRMLARFLAPHKEELEKHFVFVKFDISRDDEIAELRDRYPDSQKSGVPWFCILDAEAKVLVNSNFPMNKATSENTNIGFPTMPAEVKHFVHMLKSGAPRLPVDKLLEYEAELLKKK